MNRKSLIPLIAIVGLSGCAVSPKPLDANEIIVKVQRDKEAIKQMKPEIASKVSLNRAIARSIKYNFEARVKMLEEVIAKTDLEATSLTMLPKLAANAGYISRSNANEVLSPSSGQVSTSEDQRRRVADLQLNWSLIDFGISYYMSKQKADQLLIAEEARRKMTQQIAKETRDSFWRAYTLQKHDRRNPKFTRTVHDSVSNSRKAQEEGLMKPLEATEYRKSLWGIASGVYSQRLGLVDAKPKLLSLMHAPYSKKNIRLYTTEHENKALPAWLSLKRDSLRRLALQNRPELRQEFYEKRISLNEVTQARIKLLPDPTLDYTYFTDSNNFLVNNRWMIKTLNIAWDLMTIPNKMKNIDIAKQNASVADLRRLGLAMAIVTQVDVAKTAYDAARDLSYYQEKIYLTDKSIYEIQKNKQQSDFASGLEVKKAYLTMIASKFAWEKSYADYQIAAATLLESIGLDVLRNLDDVDMTVDELTEELAFRSGNVALTMKTEPAKPPVELATDSSTAKQGE